MARLSLALASVLSLTLLAAAAAAQGNCDTVIGWDKKTKCHSVW